MELKCIVVKYLIVIYVFISKCYCNNMNKKLINSVQNILIYNNSVYIGGTNFVQKLSYNLDVLASISTGPKNDSVYCNYKKMSSCETKHLANSYNSIMLVVENPKHSLLVCSNIYGACQFLSFDTLDDLYKDQIFGSIASNFMDAGTVAVVAEIGNPSPLIVAKPARIALPIIDRNAFIAIGAFQLSTDRLLEQYEKDGEVVHVLYNEELIFSRVDNRISKAKFFIDYKDIFIINSYYYMLTVQQDLQTSQNVSKIVRFKFTSKAFGDYIEQPLACQKGDKVFTILKSTKLIKLDSNSNKWFRRTNDYFLFGIFTAFSDSSDFALCYWSLNDIDSEMGIQRSKCAEEHDIPIASFLVDYGERCGKDFVQRFNVKIAPTKVIRGKLLLNTNGEKIGAVEALVHERGLSLYVSMEKLIMKSYALLRDGTIHQYSEETFSGDRIFTRIAADQTKTFLFMIAEQNIVRTDVDNCLMRKSCYDCLSGPSCGWCTLSRKCTEKLSCKSPEKLHYFISDNVDSCPAVFNVNPTVASIQAVSKISFEAKNIPSDIQYGCMVNTVNLNIASDGNNKFSCDELDFSKIKPYLPVNGFAQVDVNLVSLNKDGSTTKVATTFIQVYSCEEFKSCKSCITGRFSCGWCSRTLMCNENSDKCSDKVSWVPYQGQNATTYANFCPSIVSTSNKKISFDSEAEIVLNGRKLASSTEKFQYECLFKLDGMSRRSPAVYKSSTQVTCANVKLDYKSEIASLDAEIYLLFGDVFIDTQGVTVMVYKCHVGRTDCSICLTAPPEWSCGWCLNSSRCSIQKTCDIMSSWSNNKCPVPVIEAFSPTEVAIGGGATVEILGSDFGLTSDDIINVTFAGQLCKILPKEYKTSRRVVCVTTRVDSARQGKVVVTVNSTGGRVLSGTSIKDFFYRKPDIKHVSPSIGPCSGGTILKLTGEFLDVGNKVEILMNKQSCGNLMRNKTGISCETKAGQCQENRKRKRRSVSSFVEILFDNVEVFPTSGEPVEFTYVVDPVVGIVYTNKKSIFLQTFQSGGQLFRVEGQRFDAVQKPQMMFKLSNPDRVYKIPCDIKRPSYMTCLSPNMSDIHVKESGITIILGFEMDKVASIRSLRNLTVHPDPEFDSFPGADKTFVVKDDDLVLTGRHFGVLSSEDVNVTVGGLSCQVTNLEKRLGCILPKKEDVLAVNSEPVPVKVVVGEGGITYDIGYITYYVAMEEDARIIYIIIGVAFILVVLIVLIILIVWYRRRKRKEKEYEQLVQIKLDRMESQYARVAKEAFAAYQTEITDLTKDIEQTEPQYLDFRQYAMRVLYPGMASHPILETNRDESPEWESCMLSFIKLLKQKDFLLTFIRTLESQSSFQMTDRCMVASLLTVSLQDDLKYITQVLIILLTDLINKAGSSKHPKLLLRRTESVAEKLLTNWLAYTLYNFLNENVGEPLFKLFAAITTLIDKEPVDAITCDARNSLSEDKLLRQKIEFSTLTINVDFIYPTEAGVYENITVLTCDTISQTKEKIIKHIYKNKPYSEWPQPSDLQLGFTSPNGACLQLKDEDPTNIVEGDWKKINTLEHYKVPENSYMRLEPMSEANLNQSSSFANTGNNHQVVTSPRLSKFQSSKRKFNNSSTRSMQDLDQSQKGLLHENSMGSIFQPSHASTPMLHHNHHDNREPKLWHMAKQTDYPQEQKEDSRDVMAEVYLTRLLKTKETLHTFVDSLLKAIFGVNESGVRVIPQAVKYLFDFLDEKAEQLEIDSREVHHTWKNNSLPLRFWSNIIKNPNFVLDINKSNTADSCLSVVAQLFMDSCSPDVHRLGKDSPANKLLYAKEIPEYKKLVQRFYSDVRNSSFDEDSFYFALDDISTKYGDTFNNCNAASELMTYAIKYKVKIWDNLEDSGFQEHAEKLQEIMENIPDD